MKGFREGTSRNRNADWEPHVVMFQNLGLKSSYGIIYSISTVFTGSQTINSNLIGSMYYIYGIFTYIYHRNQPNVGKYTVHGCYG